MRTLMNVGRHPHQARMRARQESGSGRDRRPGHVVLGAPGHPGRGRRHAAVDRGCRPGADARPRHGCIGRGRWWRRGGSRHGGVARPVRWRSDRGAGPRPADRHAADGGRRADAEPRGLHLRKRPARRQARRPGVLRACEAQARPGGLRARHLHQRGGGTDPRPDQLRPRRRGRRRRPRRARGTPGGPRTRAARGPAGAVCPGGTAHRHGHLRATRAGAGGAVRAQQRAGAQQPGVRPAAGLRAEPRGARSPSPGSPTCSRTPKRR